uniref:Uncharacterized protein n=1 Tax=uncultured Desulfobacterium sp. TaxID=201089 RepID=E1YBH4_9BACT|nr:unknown protein [uncultured Desulfobacterium sp.]CBX29979.1 unknown protein [uncultured Desulfobacterium sp.]
MSLRINIFKVAPFIGDIKKLRRYPLMKREESQAKVDVST